MAELPFFAARLPADWRRRLAGAGLIAVGIAGVGSAGWLYYDAWSTSQTWTTSPEAEALARQAAEPTPIWVAPAAADAQPVQVQPLPTPRVVVAPAVGLAVEPAPTAMPLPEVTADQLSLDSTDFRFLDPPEPGAHARVAVTVANHASATSGRVLLGVPAPWFEGYSVVGTIPAVSEDVTDDDAMRTFSFPPVAAGASATFELHVSALVEGTTAPAIKVLLEGGDVIGEVRKPPTYAPTPRPGPVMAIDIPRLKLHSGVVQTTWEPPPFAVGQIKGTANVTQGNTVLIGHLTGAAGNVFAHLDQLQPGDEVTTYSRGLPYSFVVSRIFEGPNNDSLPMDPSDDGHLTLMTCAGIWNPFTRDYSERLWVIAEPPEQAAVTIANVAATATAEATATSAALDATATAVALIPTPTPTPAPTPYAGEPSLAGGIGNTRVNLEKAFGMATGETSGKLVVFRRPGGGEVHVQFTPDPPRAALVAVLPQAGMSFDAAVRESRKLFPTDTVPRAAGPEGNVQFVVERFTSPTLAQALGGADFSVVYTRNAKGTIDSIIVGLGDDYTDLIERARR